MRLFFIFFVTYFLPVDFLGDFAMPKDQALVDIPLVNESTAFWRDASGLWLPHKGPLLSDLRLVSR